ncbi:hypothetical protein GQ42DRAFT_29416 [Ramicandelaber brevisporus]|nr:hypothetical protein GQ42DRAFT_29416 [Ramicandelaber brevisporus]
MDAQKSAKVQTQKKLWYKGDRIARGKEKSMVPLKPKGDVVLIGYYCDGGKKFEGKPCVTTTEIYKEMLSKDPSFEYRLKQLIPDKIPAKFLQFPELIYGLTSAPELETMPPVTTTADATPVITATVTTATTDATPATEVLAAPCSMTAVAPQSMIMTAAQDTSGHGTPLMQQVSQTPQICQAKGPDSIFAQVPSPQLRAPYTVPHEHRPRLASVAGPISHIDSPLMSFNHWRSTSFVNTPLQGSITSNANTPLGIISSDRPVPVQADLSSLFTQPAQIQASSIANSVLNTCAASKLMSTAVSATYAPLPLITINDIMSTVQSAASLVKPAARVPSFTSLCTNIQSDSTANVTHQTGLSSVGLGVNDSILGGLTNYNTSVLNAELPDSLNMLNNTNSSSAAGGLMTVPIQPTVYTPLQAANFNTLTPQIPALASTTILPLDMQVPAPSLYDDLEHLYTDAASFLQQEPPLSEITTTQSPFLPSLNLQLDQPGLSPSLLPHPGVVKSSLSQTTILQTESNGSD